LGTLRVQERCFPLTTTTTTVSQYLRFPYGSFSPTVATHRAYDQHFCLAKQIPLPDLLPQRHPYLQQLSGSFEILDAPAPWWTTAVTTFPSAFHSLLSSLSPQEFRKGTINEPIWRAFKQEQKSLLKEAGVKSPRLAPLVSKYAASFDIAFQTRGPRSTPDRLQLVISGQPDYIMTMANGDGWTSCQHLYKRRHKYTNCLPANLYDPSMAVAMILPQWSNWDQDLWDSNAILARMVLRVQQVAGRELVALGKVYHNDQTTALWLIAHLIKQCEQHAIPWGVVKHTYTDWYLSQGWVPSITEHWQLDEAQTGHSQIFWLPASCGLPYIDGTHSWQGHHPSPREIADPPYETSGGRWVELRLDISSAHRQDRGT
jgi:hypothetical protein